MPGRSGASCTSLSAPVSWMLNARGAGSTHASSGTTSIVRRGAGQRAPDVADHRLVAERDEQQQDQVSSGDAAADEDGRGFSDEPVAKLVHCGEPSNGRLSSIGR